MSLEQYRIPESRAERYRQLFIENILSGNRYVLTFKEGYHLVGVPQAYHGHDSTFMVRTLTNFYDSIPFDLLAYAEQLVETSGARPFDGVSPVPEPCLGRNTDSISVEREGVFFSGQEFDALYRIMKILSSAATSVKLIDSYIDENLLHIMSKKSPSVTLSILSKNVLPATKSAAITFNSQYGGLQIRTSISFHDRFLIIDDKEYYHFGASIKDAGRRGFMFSRIEEPSITRALRAEWLRVWDAATVHL